MVIHYCVLTRIMTRLGRQSCTPHHVRSLASMSILLRDHGISLGCAKIPVDSPLHLEMKQIVDVLAGTRGPTRHRIHPIHSDSRKYSSQQLQALDSSSAISSANHSASLCISSSLLGFLLSLSTAGNFPFFSSCALASFSLNCLFKSPSSPSIIS
jgi:hypothetical protein